MRILVQHIHFFIIGPLVGVVVAFFILLKKWVMKYTVFLLSFLSFVSVHELLPYGSYRGNDFEYSENEYGNLPPEYWMPQRQPEPQRSGIMSYLPTFLCVALLGYVGYDYIEKYIPKGGYTATDYIDMSGSYTQPSSIQNQPREYAFSSYGGAASHTGQIMIKTSIWDQVMSLMTMWNIACIGSMAALVWAYHWLDPLTMWKNPQARQAVVHEDIADCFNRGKKLHQRVCAMAQQYREKEILTEKGAHAITTYVTELNEKLREYHKKATEVACQLGGYKNGISDADMANLANWEYHAKGCFEQIAYIERRMRSESDTQGFAKKMVQMYETQSAELREGNAVEGEVSTVTEEVHDSSEVDTQEGVAIHKGA